VRLACLTGLRRDDLLRFEWSDIGDVAIVMTPNKSRTRRRPKKVTVALLCECASSTDAVRREPKAMI